MMRIPIPIPTPIAAAHRVSVHQRRRQHERWYGQRFSLSILLSIACIPILTPRTSIPAIISIAR
jgi:hypothetical protein